MGEMTIARVWDMPNADTFDVPSIGAFVRKYLKQSRVSVDPFARNKRWATYTNDLNPETNADYHMEAGEFLAMLVSRKVVADLLIVDPPYSPRQIKECYDGIGRHMEQSDTLLGMIRGKLRAEIDALLGPDGAVLWFGWNTVGMGIKYGFEIAEILLVCHGSDHNDTICMAERRTQRKLQW